MSFGQEIMLYFMIIPIITFCILGLLDYALSKPSKNFVTNTRRKYRELREKQEEIEFKKELCA